MFLRDPEYNAKPDVLCRVFRCHHDLALLRVKGSAVVLEADHDIPVCSGRAVQGALRFSLCNSPVVLRTYIIYYGSSQWRS